MEQDQDEDHPQLSSATGAGTADANSTTAAANANADTNSTTANANTAVTTLPRVNNGKNIDALRKVYSQGSRGEKDSEKTSRNKRTKTTVPPSPESPYRESPKFKRGVPLSESGYCQVVSPLATVASPPRNTKTMENGRKAYICRHNNDSTLGQWGVGYWTDKLMSLKNYPTNCAGCGKRFSQGRKVPEGCVRVDNNNPAWCCNNAMNHRDHKCTYAKCFGCVVGATIAREEKEGRPKRKKQPRQIVNPGESVEVGADGEEVIVPAGESAKNRRRHAAAAAKKRAREPTTSNNKKANDRSKKLRKKQ